MEMKGEGQEGWEEGRVSVLFAHHCLCASVCVSVVISNMSPSIGATQNLYIYSCRSVAATYFYMTNLIFNDHPEGKLSCATHKDRIKVSVLGKLAF